LLDFSISVQRVTGIVGVMGKLIPVRRCSYIDRTTWPLYSSIDYTVYISTPEEYAGPFPESQGNVMTSADKL